MSPRYLANHTSGHCSLHATATIWIEMEGGRLHITKATGEALRLFGYMDISEIACLDLHEIFEVVEYLSDTNEVLTLKCKNLGHGPIWLNACAHQLHQRQHWSLRDITHQKLLTSLTSSPTPKQTNAGNVLSISPFGIVEHVFPTSFMGLNASQIVDKPMMMFVHPEDIKTLCNGLSTMLKSMYADFTVRWQTGADDSGEKTYLPVQVHAMLSEKSPICLIKPLPLKIAPQRPMPTQTKDPYIREWLVFGKVYRNCLGYIHDYLVHWNRHILMQFNHSLGAKNWNCLIESVSHDPSERKNEAAGFLVNLVATWNTFTSSK
ncbi:hypothetical protein K493DRAFT_300138 [Basidiobolus meristosporus CBS 931.73]|uniref:Uncharacterized protein n=1 Tax=Basidiobolus meristosporus CBS 931.73 TaxID=1314790 RepID=A0A1Y1YJ17_9FUNG|nr:hypothetical protein K493DRAFT_300138 [Basidiobolus meristosporus CBS 931.73]|eukprot:ORX97975.1 hypothetical protein K493DRAFT_300138 [Basidiobolus meristosporus CBS 931.73]